MFNLWFLATCMVGTWTATAFPRPSVSSHHAQHAGYMDINRISGYIPGKLVFFLMQVGGCAVALWVA